MEEVIAQLIARVDELEKMTHCAFGLVIAIFCALVAVGFACLGYYGAKTTKKGE